MNKLISTIGKELLILRRDRAGLAVLFLMPVILVVVVTLVQNNALRSTQESGIEAIIVDMDNGEAARFIQETLKENSGIAYITRINGTKIDENRARELVSRGTYPFCLLIPETLSSTLKESAQNLVKQELDLKAKRKKINTVVPAVTILFDPTLQGDFRAAVNASVQSILLTLETREKLTALSRELPEYISEEMRNILGPVPLSEENLKGLSLEKWRNTAIMDLQSQSIVPEGGNLPTSVQYNVSAWSLFGIFFIVVPLAGSFIRERQDGTLMRMQTIPISRFTFMGGKILAYLLVCYVQFLLILLLGMYFFPHIGLPSLQPGSSPASIAFIVTCSGLAAAGFGILVGSLARTYEQASMFGAVAVVIGAALGGIMVPIYVMPPAMQAVSEFSPLSWGLQAFLDVFVRGGGVQDVLLECFFLLAFFTGTLFLAWIHLFIRGRFSS